MSIKKVGFDKVSAQYANRTLQLSTTGAICRLLFTHFSVSTNIREQLLRKFTSNEDASKNLILIQPYYEWLTVKGQMRPALIVKRGSITPQRIAINDGFNETIKSGVAKNVFVNGSHSILCVSDHGGSAELLGQEIFNLLLEFTPLIREDLNFIKFDVSECAGLTKLEEFDQHFICPINITWTRQHLWALKGDGPWLQDIGSDHQIF